MSGELEFILVNANNVNNAGNANNAGKGNRALGEPRGQGSDGINAVVG